MTNEYELADDDRQRLIYTKDMLLAPLLPGMEQPPHPMRLGDEQDYYARGPESARGRLDGGAAGGPAATSERRTADARPVAASRLIRAGRPSDRPARGRDRRAAG